GEPKTGKGPKGKGDDKMLDGVLMENVTSLQRLALSQDAQGRELAAAMFHFWLAPGKSNPVKVGKKAVSDYQNQVKIKGKGRGMGPPHLQVAMAMMEAMHAELRDSPREKVLKKWLELANREDKGQTVVSETFSACRLKDACQKDDSRPEERKTKVTVNFNKWADFADFGKEDLDLPTIEEVRRAFLKGMEKAGAEKIRGQ
ncbi:unnamed protein product, partial [Prorocentrum cordatum]